jgi:hypothetical protein
VTAPLEETDAQLLALMREHVASFADGPVRTVAVVGNAPMEPSRERAERIDACDLVVRVNSFWCDEAGEPPSHGRRTHVVVFNRLLRATPHLFRDHRNRAYFLTEGGHVTIRRLRPYPTYWPQDLGVWPIPNRAVVAGLRHALDPAGEEDELVVPTTGTTAAWLPHLLFPDARLLLTGYSFLKDPHQTSWAHHKGGTVPVVAHHKIGREGALLQSWVDAGRADVVE